MAPSLRFLLIPVLLFAMHTLALAGVVHADGIIRVKGGNWANARVTLIPELGEPRVIERSSARFTLDLPLQATYLLRAEYDNAATKEVMFDLRVPARYEDSDFDFPFEITLEVEESGIVTPFAGPVGLVSFDKALEDLDYVTDHRLLAMSRTARELGAKVKRMEPVRVAELAQPEPSRNPLSTPLIASSGTVKTVEEPVLELVSPRQSTLPTTIAVEAPKPITAPVSISTPLPALTDKRSAAIAETPSSSEHEVQREDALDVEVSPAMVAETQTMQQAAPRASTLRSTDCGQEHMLEYPSMLVAIRYVPLPNGNCDEMRKVTHTYGGVFYFQNGRDITEWEYDQLLGN